MSNIITSPFGGSFAQEPRPKDYAYSRLLPYARLHMPNYIIGKHHKLTAHYLQKLERGEITRLAIFMPPRHGKTMLASEFFSAWYLGRNPMHEIIFASYAQDRSDDVGKAVRDLMFSDVHEAVFPEGKLRTDAKGTRKFQTIQDGTFFTTSWKGATTGRGANCFPAGTLVDTEVGKIDISVLHEMIDPPRVLSLDTLGQLCYSNIECSRKIKGKSVYEFSTTSGKTLRGTPDHRIYSRTRGFIKLRDLYVGEKLLCVSSNMETRQTLDIELYKVQGNVCPIQCGCSEIHKKGLCRYLLFCQMFKERSCYEEQQKMRCLQRIIAKIQNWKKIWSRLLSGLFSFSSPCNETSKNPLQRMWSLVLAKKFKKRILQCRLCKQCPLRKNDGRRQLSFQEWRKLCFSVLQNEATYFGERPIPLCCLRHCKKDYPYRSQVYENKIKSCYSSFRSRSEKQFSREFGYNVSSLSHNSAQIECDSVSVAPRLCDDSNEVSVYDIQVAEQRNFFANEILVHNCLILDDLVKDREDANSDINRRKREEWFSSSGYTRLMADEDSSEGRILLIMTRWAYDDIAAYLLSQLAHERWHILNCPAIAEEENDALGRKPGEALWPEKYPLSRLVNIKQSVISSDWNSLYQQRPLPKEGGMWKLYWFKDYNPHHLRRIEDLKKDGQELPEELSWFHRIVISLDTAYKPDQMNDPTVATVWGYSKHRQYLLEVLSERLEYPQLKKWIIKIHQKYAAWNFGPVPVLIEDAASGQSLIQDFKVSEYRMPVIKIPTVKSKIVRAEHATSYAEGGNIILPEKAPWRTDFETEFARFPFATHDDQVDSLSQYINWFYKPKKRKRKGKIFFK